jgi:two-component sensor histidine kinase
VRSQTGRYADAGSGRIAVLGPTVFLNSAATQAIGMALHELSTNALRYGALSNEAGHVAVGWRIDRSGDEPMLEMYWSERNGLPVETTPQRGFGTIVIKEMLAQRLNAVVSLSFDAPGIAWRLRAPLRNIEAADESPG